MRSEVISRVLAGLRASFVRTLVRKVRRRDVRGGLAVKKVVVAVLGGVLVALQLAFGVGMVRIAVCDPGQSYSDRVEPASGRLASVLRCENHKKDEAYDRRYDGAEQGDEAEVAVAAAALRASYRANEIAAAQLRLDVLEALAVTLTLSLAAVGVLIQALEMRARRRRR